MVHLNCLSANDPLALDVTGNPPHPTPLKMWLETSDIGSGSSKAALRMAGLTPHIMGHPPCTAPLKAL